MVSLFKGLSYVFCMIYSFDIVFILLFTKSSKKEINIGPTLERSIYFDREYKSNDEGIIMLIYFQ